MIVKLRNVRLAFPAIFEKKAVNAGDTPAYSAVFLLHPEKHAAELATINAAIEQVARDKWGEKGPAQLAALRASLKVCLHKGEEKAQYTGFPGHLFISARAADVKPKVVDKDPNVDLTKESGKIYAGCYVNASIDIFAQDNSYGKRINAGLRGVQFAGDGEAFGGGSAATADEFDDLTFEDGADDLV